MLTYLNLSTFTDTPLMSNIETYTNGLFSSHLPFEGSVWDFFNLNAKIKWKLSTEYLKAIWNLQNKGNHWHSRRPISLGSNM